MLRDDLTVGIVDDGAAGCRDASIGDVPRDRAPIEREAMRSRARRPRPRAPRVHVRLGRGR